MWLLLTTVALAGYGEPIAGVPTPAGRELHAWADVARVDVGYFGAKLSCWDAVTPTERLPHAPLAYDPGLGAAAQAHSEDMDATDRLSHRSSDGTRFADRVWSWYDGWKIGENIARGYRTAKATVRAWLCSDGHREHLLSDAYTDSGTGNAGSYWTEDLGDDRDVEPPLRMGAHTPLVPTDTVTLMASLEVPVAPRRVVAVLDGTSRTMSVMAGTATRGVWSVVAPVGPGCHTYRFVARLADGTVGRFPETGAYGFGTCPWTDVEAQWLDATALASLR